VPEELERLHREIVGCRRCPRLVAWRESVAADPPRRYRGERYWARPLPGFGDRDARVVLVGLAPAAHGGNRTGRIFTGDRSGDWLVAALHRAGYANQPRSESLDDGLRLTDAFVTAVNRCPPPANRPTTTERDNCLPYLVSELQLLVRARVLVALGSFAWDGALRAIRALGEEVPRPKPRWSLQTARLLSPLPAEHLHRQAHRGDARRRVRPGARAQPLTAGSAVGRPQRH
jgi:uracil-DNA glycosylase family 4